MQAVSQIDGLASGLNTTEIIEAILEFERRPAVLMEVDRAEKTNIISTLKALEAKLLALKSKSQALTRNTAFNQGSVQVSDESVLKATALGRVAAGSYDLQVQALARNHQIASAGYNDESLSTFGTGTITLGVGSTSPKTITIDSSNNSLVGIKQAINDANAGVTATIINDGSDINKYRLVLSASETGRQNKISIESHLTGGSNLNFSSAAFDVPETISFDSGSDARVALGSTASYSGNENKVYTFTVAGTGEQTVGSDAIQVDWTDGTNSGSILVTQADDEVELVGEGADGLKLSFSAGQLKSGDSFQVQTFAPLLQDASDAKVTIGSSGGTGSPITVTSSTNTINDLIGGVKLELTKETAPGDHVNISTDINIDGIKAKVNEFITAFNSVNEFVDKQNTFNEEAKETGVLFGDPLVQAMQYEVRDAMSSAVRGLESKYNQLATIGIRTDVNGKLAIKDSSLFEKAIREDLDAVIDLFSDSGSSANTAIEFVAAGTETRIGDDYAVNITQVATRGYFKGSSISELSSSPIQLNSSNNRLKIKVDNVESNDLILAEKSYDSIEELVQEIQEKIDADDKIGSRGLTVEWVNVGGGMGHLKFTDDSYGSTSEVEMITSVPSSALASLGLAGGVSVVGKDVAGTINGEEAEGKGQYLTGIEGNKTTDGLKLKITLTEDQLGAGDEGTITLSKGVASRMRDTLDSLTKFGEGLLSRRIKTYESQNENLAERISEFDERLALRRERLVRQFQRMEEVLGQLNAQGSYLEGQLANIEANWKR